MVEIISCSDGGLAIGGFSHLSSRSNDFVLIKTDSSGDLYWVRTYGTSSNEHLHALAKCQDNGFLLLGERDFDIPWLLRIDSSGDEMWNKTYPQVNQDVSSLDDIVELPNGDIVTAGKLKMEGQNYTQAWIYRLDFDGNVVWSRFHGNTSNSLVCTAIASCENGDIMMFGNSYRPEDGEGNFWGMRLNGSGDIIWERIYDKAGHEFLMSGLETHDGGFAMTGRWEPEGWPTFPNRVYSIRTDSHGVLLWNRTYADNDQRFPTQESTSGVDIVQCEDNGFAMFGWTHSISNKGQNLWLVRTDESGEKLWANTLIRDSLDFPKSMVNQGARFAALATTTDSPVASEYDTMLVFFYDINPLNQSTSATTPTPFDLTNLVIFSGASMIVAIPILYWIVRRRKTSPANAVRTG
ncbi:MAG: hypothetical protein EAX87_08380 [Candidatus Thorarchaeota archaeon]|nr:hypothetical protein [Candidatus Thorarchaeota archaeon]